MEFQVDVWLRGTEVAATHTVTTVEREVASWTDADVAEVLREMLRAMNREKFPGVPEPPFTLRGISWIVNPFEAGGVVIAIEITLGAAVAGPFPIPQERLNEMLTRVMARATVPVAPSGETIH